MPFTAEQVEQLLHPINPARVLRDGKGHSHVSQQDVTAHLIRVFGFGSFDTDVRAAEMVFEQERGPGSGRWDVCYRALVRLTVRDPDGLEVCHYEDGSTATAQNQSRGDAHDLAYKSAISLSVKRAAKDLGDQFGLSLYNKGQMAGLVLGTLVGQRTPPPRRDMQVGVPQQVSLGNDEVDPDVDVGPAVAPPPPVTRTMRRAKATPEPKQPPAEPETETGEAITPAQLKALHASFNGAAIVGRELRLEFCQRLLGRDITSSNDLTKAEASRVIDVLQDHFRDARNAPDDSAEGGE